MLPTGGFTICIIIGGIDRSKFRYPRSRVVNSKQFSSFVRPCMDMVAAITHGHHTILALSEPWVKKDSSFTCELFCHSLHMIPGDLRDGEILLQADNCSRENKNNSTCRLMALLVGGHRARRAELRFLLSGHSHEDVDQFFSNVSSVLEQHPELHVPSQFISVLDRWLAEPTTRPHEKAHFIRKVDQTRDWQLDGCLVRL